LLLFSSASAHGKKKWAGFLSPPAKFAFFVIYAANRCLISKILLSTSWIPSSVTTLGNSSNGAVFDDCHSLRTIISLRATVPTAGDNNTFRQVPSDCMVYVPEGSVDAYRAAARWSDFGARIVNGLESPAYISAAPQQAIDALAGLKNTIAELEDEISDLKADKVALNTTIEGLEEEISDLEGEIDDLNDIVSAKDIEIAGLSHKNMYSFLQFQKIFSFLDNFF